MTSSYFYCAIFCYFFVFHKTYGQNPTYQCKEELWRFLCILSNINQTSAQKHFKVIPHRDVSQITSVEFINSKMEVLTANICDALPNLQVLNLLPNLGLTSIDENAFSKCTKLGAVDLRGNSLTTLPSGVFDSNVDLQVVWLQNNKLTEIDGNLFKHNPNLGRIYLNNNKLQEFSFSTEMPVMTKMEKIDLSNNELSDVDIETLLEKCPNLKEIKLDGNNFSCDRQLQIIDALKAKNVVYDITQCIEKIP